MNLSIPTSTWVWLAIIISIFFFCLLLVIKFKKSNKLLANRRVVEYLPTLISTLGVLGTFFGITMGLISFETKDLDKSIPGLLDGLKTAFFTSLAGMIGSMILSAFISKKQDEKDGGVSDINQAAGTICLAVQQMSDLTKTTIQDLAKQIKDQDTDRKAFYKTMGSMMDRVKNTQSVITENLINVNARQIEMSSALDSIVILERSKERMLEQTKSQVSAIKATTELIEKSSDFQAKSYQWIMKTFSDVSKDTHHIGELLDIVSGINGTQDKISDQIWVKRKSPWMRLTKNHDTAVQVEVKVPHSSKFRTEPFHSGIV